MSARNVPSPGAPSSRAPLSAGLCIALVGATFGAGAAADTVEERLERRGFPSIFQAWSPVENVGDEGELDGVARHDFYFRTLESYGLQWDGPYRGLATSFGAEGIGKGLAKRAALLERNPDIVMLAELRYRDGTPGFLPEDHPWWLRDERGERVIGWPEGGSHRLDIGNREFIAHVIERARAIVDTGVVDGVLLDVWNEYEQPYVDDRAALIQGVRAAVGDALIVVNSNDLKSPRSAPYVNGIYMENAIGTDAATWANYREVMEWAEANLRPPAFTAFETWQGVPRGAPEDANRQDADDLRRMRATTTLSLVASDGFALFADPNWYAASDHLHDWYAFWDVELGRPAGPAVDLVGGAVRRDYDGGVAVYAPPGSSTGSVEFERTMRSARTGAEATSHPIRAFDGDLFVPVGDAPAEPAPVPVPQPEPTSEPTSGADATIGDFAPAARVSAGGRTVVSVPYATDAAADLVVSLQDVTDDWKPVGFARVPVPAGADTRRVPIDVAADAAPGAGYAWTAWLVPRGGEWAERLDAATVRDVTLLAAGEGGEDDVAGVDAPRALAPGERFTVDVSYEAAAGRRVHVTLQDLARGWRTEAYARVDVAAGVGTASVSLELAADAKPGGRYALSAYLTPAGKNWDERLDVVRVDGLRVGRR